MHAWYWGGKRKRKGERRERERETLKLPAWLGGGGRAWNLYVRAHASGKAMADVYVVGRPGDGWMDGIYLGMDNRRCLQPSPSPPYLASPSRPACLLACLPASLRGVPVERQSRAKADSWVPFVRGCGCRVVFYAMLCYAMLCMIDGPI